MKQSLIFFIRAYRAVISPFLGNRCRFYPSCSEYTQQALNRKNIFHAAALSFWRVLRCNPLSSGGFDPVE